MKSLPPNFRDKVFIDALTGCWLWKASTKAGGYGQFWFEGKRWAAHRFAYTKLVSSISEGMHLDHYRINPGPRNAPCSRNCVNPEHLEPVTLAENNKRGRKGKKGRHNSEKTHCPSGHSYSEDNIYRYRGLRYCRECQRINSHKQAQKNKITNGPVV